MRAGPRTRRTAPRARERPLPRGPRGRPPRWKPPRASPPPAARPALTRGRARLGEERRVEAEVERAERIEDRPQVARHLGLDEGRERAVGRRVLGLDGSRRLLLRLELGVGVAIARVARDELEPDAPRALPIGGALVERRDPVEHGLLLLAPRGVRGDR